jgi:hypothetical protein
MTDTALEEWRPTLGYEGLYSVSSLGRVRSEPRTVVDCKGRPARRKGTVLKPSVSRGYHLVQLCRDGTIVCRGIHVLVLEAFIGPRPDGHQACHRDGVRSNNALANLRWDTQAGNFADMVDHGTRRRGSRHHLSKLTADQVRAIRADGRTLKAIAADYGITFTNVHHIKTRASWAWLE